MKYLGLFASFWATGALAAAPGYTDQGTSAWFQSLMVPSTTNSCCNQADCGPTPARWVDGTWLAESRQKPGEWLPVPACRVLPEPSIFGELAVLCESDRQNGNDEPIRSIPSGIEIWVYCLSPPLQGF